MIAGVKDDEYAAAEEEEAAGGGVQGQVAQRSHG